MTETHPLEVLIGLSSLLDGTSVRDLERHVALHAQGQLNASCEDVEIVGLLEAVLTSWLYERVHPRAAGSDYDALTSVILEPDFAAQQLGKSARDLANVLIRAATEGYLTVEHHDCGSDGWVYVVDFLPLIASSIDGLLDKLDRRWRALQFLRLRETWSSANRELAWTLGDFDAAAPGARRMRELERAWRQLNGECAGLFDASAAPREVDPLYVALEELARIQEEAVALSGQGDQLLSGVLAKHAHFRAQHRRLAALVAAH